MCLRGRGRDGQGRAGRVDECIRRMSNGVESNWLASIPFTGEAEGVNLHVDEWHRWGGGETG